ncbi:MAG: DNA/RNA non-specific endonuclease [Solobacterium sp.]|nr:DNA/RNA non-specific endonuclease [Solobacterium sp.]
MKIAQSQYALWLVLGTAACLFLFVMVRGMRHSLRRKKWKTAAADLAVIFIILGSAYWYFFVYEAPVQTDIPFVYEELPAYSDAAVTEINNNIPYFTEEEKQAEEYELYGSLDKLGRCTSAMAMIGRDMMPQEERGEIETIRPTGFIGARYDDLIEDGFLYNRCHLIAFELTGENANERNLITGTRYLNVEGMLYYENITASYIRRTENHVLYRVTPVFLGSELVARGVLMEAYSIEDSGAGICFCVWCWNVQPGIRIDYATGKSSREKPA